jgi:hypothetical protein
MNESEAPWHNVFFVFRLFRVGTGLWCKLIDSLSQVQSVGGKWKKIFNQKIFHYSF